jgi:integration host factor subunit beta
MNESDLAGALSKGIGLPLRKAEEVVQIVPNSMANALADGDRVEIKGFGSPEVKRYDGYAGRNSKTGGTIKVKPRKLTCLKWDKELKKTAAISHR